MGNMQNAEYGKLKRLLLFVVVIKLIASYFIDLGNDEAYYYTYALQPDYNHFDHPPMVGFLIQLTTFNLHWVNNISMRLGAIACSAAATFFLYRLTSLLFNSRTAWFSSLIFQCSIYTSVIAGLFILPDSPQMPLYIGALWLMASLLFDNTAKHLQLIYWLLLGACIGLAALCKIHALYLWAGFGLYLILQQPKWLLNYRLYLAALVTLLFLLPIWYWNVQNNFITYAFHAERVTHRHLSWDSLLQEILGEVLYQNPVIALLTAVSVIFATKQLLGKSTKQAVLIWLLCMSIPMLLLFWGLSLFNPTLPHWSGPAYIPLFIIGAYYLHHKQTSYTPLYLRIAGSLVLIALVAATLLIQLAPFQTGNKTVARYGEGCPTLDVSGWQALYTDFDSLSKTDVEKGIMQENSPILVNKWFPAAQLELYVGSKMPQHTLLGVGTLPNLHKFAWLNKERTWLQLHQNAYCIVPSNNPMNVEEEYGKYFEKISTPDTLPQIRGGAVVRYFLVYRLRNCINIPSKP